jgi:hypothetical protein
MAKKRRSGRRSLCAALAGLLCVGVATSATAWERPQWVRQLGTSETDVSYGVATDGEGNVYISGYIADALLAKYSAAGALLWTSRLEGSGSSSVTIDGDGNVYISGGTYGSLDGPNLGSTDAFVAKYSADGALLWARQLGTSEYDASYGVATDGEGNVYITGWTDGSLAGPYRGDFDTFVAKYSAGGALLWTSQFGTSSGDISLGIATDSEGNVYITGLSADAWLIKYSPTGALTWTRQLKRAEPRGVATDGAGNVYISGGTNGGERDAFVIKYSPVGALLWTRQIGTSKSDYSYGVETDAAGNVYITGETLGSLGGANQGGGDAFLAKYSAAGALRWRRQLGTPESDHPWGIATDGDGNVYISGETWGSLGGANQGGTDAFVAKYHTRR